nr:zinc finger, CCHC-type, retrotransposon Gag domain protein [Tanacetum cinerariifolium]
EEIREEFCTGSGSSNAGGNPPPVTIQTWLERFNKQKPHSFEKATVLFFPRSEKERLKREYHSIRQTSTETSTEFMQRFL